jgi:hypothetical protein
MRLALRRAIKLPTENAYFVSYKHIYGFLITKFKRLGLVSRHLQQDTNVGSRVDHRDNNVYFRTVAVHSIGHNCPRPFLALVEGYQGGFSGRQRAHQDGQEIADTL